MVVIRENPAPSRSRLCFVAIDTSTRCFIERVFGTGLDVPLPPGGVLDRRQLIQREGVRVLGDFDEEGNAPSAAGSRAEASGHLAGALGPFTPAVVNQLAHRHAVAVADFVVEVHSTYIVSRAATTVVFGLLRNPNRYRNRVDTHKGDNTSSIDAARGISARRILIIGLDGATFDVLKPMMDEGLMPNVRRAVTQGASGILQSTTPPITPAAWTTFLTGKQPGSHGIIDFERYDVHSNKLSFNNTQRLARVRTIWQIMSDHGLKVGSVTVPMTWPPTPVNGFVVTGFDTPSTRAHFAHPTEIETEILQRWPDPILGTNWRRKTFGGDRLFAENIDYMCHSFHQGAEMTIWLADRFGWDVVMVVMKLVDNLQHKAWKYLDPRWSHRNPRRSKIARRGFVEADQAVGKLMDYAKVNNATVLMVSDHGHGSLEAKVQPNRLLHRWGYLALQTRPVQWRTRAQYVWDRLRGRTGKFARRGDIAHDLAVDFSKTQACVMHAGMAGFLYVNLAGRQPTGIVSQDEYEALRDELRERLLSEDCHVRNPAGESIQLFSAVHKPEELYGCSREDQPWLPDLILTPHNGLAVVRKIRGSGVVRWLPYRRLEGTHRPDGILIATGPGIRQTTDLHAHIADCAPTILAALGVPIPADMNGHVIESLFNSPPQITYQQTEQVIVGESTETVYSERDLQQVTERLADLGYLE